MVLASFTEFYWLSLDSAGFYSVLLGLDGLLFGFIEFYLGYLGLILGFTGFKRV